MERATLERVGRKIITVAAYGGGGLGLLGALGATTYGLLRTQASLARRTIESRPVDPLPDPDGVYDPDGTWTPRTPSLTEPTERSAEPDSTASHPSRPRLIHPRPIHPRRTEPNERSVSIGSRPLSFVVIGDSSAAGYGAGERSDTPAAVMARGLAAATERSVGLTTVAVVGAQSSDLARQVDEALVQRPEVACITIGGNDVTHRISPDESRELLGDAVRRLRAAGCEVVVGTCPDLGTIRPIQPPLRWLARTMSRTLAAAQTTAVLEAGGRTVSLGSLLGPEFASRPGRYFSVDQFHPSPLGYKKAAEAMLPSLLAALGIDDDTDAAGELVPPAAGAAEAANAPGTEATSRRDGRFAFLRRRVNTDYSDGQSADTVTVTTE